MTKISIVIINYNYGAFLAQAVESALAQNARAHEVIVVDDGSTDGSMEVIGRYRDRVVVVEKERGGHVSAANAGFGRATGDICIFLDADDILYPDCITKVLAAWRPGVSKIQYRLDTIDRAGNDQAMTFPHFPRSLTPEAIRRQAFSTGTHPWTVSSGCAFVRSYLSQLMPIDANRICRSPDGYLSMMAPLYGDVLSLPDVLGAYRVHGANDWAQSGGSMSIQKIVLTLEFHRVLETAFVEQAAKVGVPLRSPLLPAFDHLEYCALALRFAPGQTPYRYSRLGLMWSSFCMTLHTRDKAVAERIARLCWLAAIMVAPKTLIEAWFGRLRGQSGRNEIAKKLIGWARGRQ